jgi:cell division GTPase FtsZ
MGDRAVSDEAISRNKGWRVSILLLSLGGGGGNILRSLKGLFRRDLAVTQKIDTKYAERLRRALSTRFLDTNEFSLSDVPPEERVLIGARTTGLLGARHNPDVARQALEESRDEVELLLGSHTVVIVIGTGGKGTGAGTMFPITQMARQQQKLVIPIFVRPSFERHEVDKRRFDHALGVIEQFDETQIRLIEIMNDQGYADTDPEPQSVVWERMNLPIARGLRGLIYVLSDLSQVDPSDLSTLFAGAGRLRIGYSEIDPSTSREPTDKQVEGAVRNCWQNPYYAFGKAVGTSLICIQGDWSNVVDARIKGGLAALASGGAPDSSYNPLYARALRVPKPWGVTALFSEYTGHHPPLAIDWTRERRASRVIGGHDSRNQSAQGEVVIRSASAVEPVVTAFQNAAQKENVDLHSVESTFHEEATPSFPSLSAFAVAVNRGDPAALALAADGAKCDIPIDGREVRKLLGTVWFRGVVPQLSQEWRERILEALVTSAPIPNHLLKVDRRAVRLSELSHAQLNDVFTKAYVPDTARADLELLLTVGRLWGPQSLERFRFSGVSENNERSKLASVLQGFRK